MAQKPHPYLNNLSFIIFGHGGAAHSHPTNTMIAFKEAFKSGADYLESDVQTTKDGEPVIMHDSTLDRTTNGKGRVIDKTLAEIKQLDAGYNFTNDGGKTYPF